MTEPTTSERLLSYADNEWPDGTHATAERAAFLALAATDEALRQEHLGHLAWQASHAAQESRRAGYGRHEDGVQRGDYTTPGCSSCERLRENEKIAKEVGG